jgi:hypothetical protein
VIQGKEDKVYLLKKALYGLKQAPRAWYLNNQHNKSGIIKVDLANYNFERVDLAKSGI